MRKNVGLVLVLFMVGVFLVPIGWLWLYRSDPKDLAQSSSSSDSSFHTKRTQDAATVALNSWGKKSRESSGEDLPIVSAKQARRMPRTYVAPDVAGHLPTTVYAEINQGKAHGDDSISIIFFELLSKCQEFETQRAILKNDKEDSKPSALESDCGDLPRDAYELGDMLMRRMLDRGVWEAKYLYAMGYFTPFRNTGDIIRSPDQYSAYKRETVKILNEMIDEGFVQAIYRMAHLYQGEWFDRDPVSAYAYLHAGANAEGNRDKMASIESMVREKLDRESQLAFRVLSMSIYNRCCAN